MADHAAVADFYGRWAGLYDLIASRTPGVRRARGRAVDALSLSRGATVVEMGCGTGTNLPLLRDRVGPSGSVVGVDLTRGVLELARRRTRRGGWRNVHLVGGDATRPPVAAADAILGTFVVGMFDDPAVAVEGWADLVRDGGRIALLDAAPRGRAGFLDHAFRLFVALGAPPTKTLRYEESPARRLDERVVAAREALVARGEVTRDERLWRGFLRLTAAEVG